MIEFICTLRFLLNILIALGASGVLGFAAIMWMTIRHD